MKQLIWFCTSEAHQGYLIIKYVILVRHCYDRQTLSTASQAASAHGAINAKFLQLPLRKKGCPRMHPSKTLLQRKTIDSDYFFINFETNFIVAEEVTVQKVYCICDAGRR